MFTLLQQTSQCLTHASEIGQLCFDLRHPRIRNRPDGFSISAVLELEQGTDFIKGESKVLCSLDESNPANERNWVLPVAANACWYGQK